MKKRNPFAQDLRSPKYKKDGKTPDLSSYQASMLEWGISKLDDIKEAA